MIRRKRHCGFQESRIPGQRSFTGLNSQVCNPVSVWPIAPRLESAIMPLMLPRNILVALPVLFLCLAGQPMYRLGAFIEPSHAALGAAAAAMERAASHGSSKTDDERVPERAWPIELVGFFPGGIGASEQAYRVPAIKRLGWDIDSGTAACWVDGVSTARRISPKVLPEQFAVASIGLAAHPIHTHAPPLAV